MFNFALFNLKNTKSYEKKAFNYSFFNQYPFVKSQENAWEIGLFTSEIRN